MKPPRNCPIETLPAGTSLPISTTVPAKSQPLIVPGVGQVNDMLPVGRVQRCGDNFDASNRQGDEWNVQKKTGRRLGTNRSSLGLGTGIGFCSTFDSFVCLNDDGAHSCRHDGWEGFKMGSRPGYIGSWRVIINHLLGDR